MSVWLWILFLVVAAAVYAWATGVTLFKVAYFLYTRTFLGQVIHNRTLKKYRGQPAHTVSTHVDCGQFTVTVVPYSQDNYGYVLMDKATKHMALVDPADPARIMDAVVACGVRHQIAEPLSHVQAILTTHYHMDHAGGNRELVRRLGSQLRVYGGSQEPVAAVTDVCKGGDCIEIGSTSIDVLFTPCHTKGHIMFYVPMAGASGAGSPALSAGRAGALFTGDAVFVAGCGKFFEGTAAQMSTTINNVVNVLPADTLVFCGHEYTADNAAFAAWVEPDNQAVKELLKLCDERQQEHKPTVPSTLRAERLHNPFFRCGQASVQQKCGTSTVIDTMQALRALKDAKAHRQAPSSS